MIMSLYARHKCYENSRPTRGGILRRETERTVHDLAYRPCLRHTRSGHQQPKETCGAGILYNRIKFITFLQLFHMSGTVWHGLGPADHHTEGYRHV